MTEEHSPVFLHGDGVTLSPFGEDDLEFCRDLVADTRVRQGLSTAMPLRVEDHREFRIEADDTISFVVRAPAAGNGGDAADAPEDVGAGPRVGVLDLVHLNHQFGTVEVGYFFHPDHWGNGYATAAVDCAIDYAFEELRLEKVYANVFEANEASARVLEKAEFDREAVLPEQAYLAGERVDVYRYGMMARKRNGD